MHDNLNLFGASAAACLVVVLRTCGQTDVTSWLVWLTWGLALAAVEARMQKLCPAKAPGVRKNFYPLRFAYEDVWDRGLCVWGELIGYL